ncbi:hypothetical protein [Anaeromyxobacter sp. SG17]
MAVVVERHRGRAAVVASLRDPRLLLAQYQEVARMLNANGDHLPLWPDRLLRLLSDPS